MNKAAAALCRVYQAVFFPALAARKEPKLMIGEGTLAHLPDFLRSQGYLHPLIIASRDPSRPGLPEMLTAALKAKGYGYILFDGVFSNPPFDRVYEARTVAIKNNCDSIISLGSDDAIRVGKAVGALLANPSATLVSLRGYGKVRKSFRMHIAIPSAPGSCSEASMATVLANPKTGERCVITDQRIIPTAVAIDPSLAVGLSKEEIAYGGLNALAHAIEAYLGWRAPKAAKRDAIEGLRLLADNLALLYEDPTDHKAYLSLQKASFLSAVASASAGVGYAHAIAHALSYHCSLPHAVGVAVSLPPVLRAYGKKADKKLARLSDALSLAPYSVSKEQKAQTFISWLEKLSDRLGVPKAIGRAVAKEDLPALAETAAREANPYYRVPKELGKRELMAICKEIGNL